MKTLLLLILLLQKEPPLVERLPADIDAAAEARRSEKVIFANNVLRVMEVKVPRSLKELHFAPDRTGFFVLGGSRVIWQTGPVVIRGEAVHVEFLKARTAKPVRASAGAVFENSLIRVEQAESNEVKWLEKERVLLLKQVRVAVKF